MRDLTERAYSMAIEHVHLEPCCGVRRLGRKVIVMMLLVYYCYCFSDTDSLRIRNGIIGSQPIYDEGTQRRAIANANE